VAFWSGFLNNDASTGCVRGRCSLAIGGLSCLEVAGRHLSRTAA
jgi:hypothetical protein